MCGGFGLEFVVAATSADECARFGVHQNINFVTIAVRSGSDRFSGVQLTTKLSVFLRVPIYGNTVAWLTHETN